MQDLVSRFNACICLFKFCALILAHSHEARKLCELRGLAYVCKALERMTRSNLNKLDKTMPGTNRHEICTHVNF